MQLRPFSRMLLTEDPAHGSGPPRPAGQSLLSPRISMDIITSVTYRLASQETGSSEVRIEVSRPYVDAAGDWVCAVTLPGPLGPRQDVHGVDALQALCLAADLIRRELEKYQGNLSWPGVPGPVPLESFRLGGGFG